MSVIFGSDGRIIGDTGNSGGGGGGEGGDSVTDHAGKLAQFAGKMLGIPGGVGEVSMLANLDIQKGGLGADKPLGIAEMFNARGGKLAEIFFKIFSKAGGEIKSYVEGIQGLEIASLSYGELGNLQPLSTGENMMAGRGAGMDFG